VDHRERLALAEHQAQEDLPVQAGHLEQVDLLERVALLGLAEAEDLLEQADHQVLLGQVDHQAHLELVVLLGLEARLTGPLTFKELYMEQIARLS
jgi:hypothetical protein